MSFSVTGPLGPHIQHMGAARGSARHAVTKHRIVAKPSPALTRAAASDGRGPQHRHPASWPRPSPKVARNLGTLTFLRARENVAIPTITIQIMK